MRKMGIGLIIGLFPLLALAQAKEEGGVGGTGHSADVRVEQVDEGVFQGIFSKMWTRLRAISPKLMVDSTGRQTTVVAGVRGAETTESLLQPYWKDDREMDPAFTEQVRVYTQAQQLADEGDVAGAASAFDAFQQKYPEGVLRPHAQFASAVAHGALGEVDKSKQALQALLAEYPEHPLSADARELLAALQ